LQDEIKLLSKASSGGAAKANYKENTKEHSLKKKEGLSHSENFILPESSVKSIVVAIYSILILLLIVIIWLIVKLLKWDAHVFEKRLIRL